MFYNIKERYKRLDISLKSAIWLTSVGVLQKGMSFLTTPIFTRILSVSQFGLVSIYNTWFNIFLIVISLNLFYGSYNTAMVKYKNQREEYQASIIGLIIFNSLLFGLLMFLVDKYIVDFFHYTNLVLILMIIQIIAQSITNLWTEKKKFEYNYFKVSIVISIIAVLSPILSVFAILTFNYDSVTIKILTNIIPITLFSIIFLYSLIVKRVKFFNWTYWKYAIAFNFPLLFHYLSTVVLGQSDRLMINYLINESSAGIYSVVYSLGFVLTLVSSAINQSFTPLLYRNLEKGTYKSIFRVVYLLIILVGISISFLVLIGPELLYILAPIEYQQAIWIIPPIAVSVLFTFLYQLFGNIEFFYSKTKYMTYMSIVLALLNIILNYLFIKRFGYFAAAYTTLFCYIIFGFSHYFFAKHTMVQRELKWDISFKNIFSICFFFLTISFLIMLLYNYMIIRVLIFITLLIILVAKRSSILRIYNRSKITREKE